MTIGTLTLDGREEPNLPPCHAAMWWWVWTQKASRGESIAQLSGRTHYGDVEKHILIADAILALDLKADDELLDIGCAAGYTGIWFAEKLKRYFGVDYSQGALAKFGIDKLAVADARKLPFRDGAFNKTYMASVLLCMNKYECLQAVREMRRVTRTRGMVADTLIGDGNGRHETNRVTYFDSLQELAAMFREAGWSDVQFRRMHPLLPHSKKAIDAVLTP